ncbi:hypothetical protein ScPMuIL_007777 [Solemya velum]
MCPRVEEKQDTEHFLQTCTNLKDPRKNIWTAPTIIQEKLYGTIEDLQKSTILSKNQYPSKPRMAPQDWDMILKRPRTARDPYTCMSETQIRNLTDDSSAFFHFSRPEKPYPDTGWHRRRHATTTDRMLIRGPPATQPYCWVDSQWQREPRLTTTRVELAPRNDGARRKQGLGQSPISTKLTTPNDMSTRNCIGDTPPTSRDR